MHDARTDGTDGLPSLLSIALLSIDSSFRKQLSILDIGDTLSMKHDSLLSFTIEALGRRIFKCIKIPRIFYLFDVFYYNSHV